MTHNEDDWIPKNLDEQLAILTEKLNKAKEEREQWKKETTSKKKSTILSKSKSRQPSQKYSPPRKYKLNLRETSGDVPSKESKGPT